MKRKHWVYKMIELQKKYKARDEVVWNMRDTLSGLRYIAKSSAVQYGGFHQNAIMTAKSAIHHIARLKKQTNARLDRPEGAKETP